jgi:hypothetical protein
MSYLDCEQRSNQEIAMLVLVLKSTLERLTNWVATLALGSLTRAADLSADADMCLLLRVEVPRSAYRHGAK